MRFGTAFSRSNSVAVFQVFTAEGVFVREIFPQGKGKGRYAGLACDNHGYLLATRCPCHKTFFFFVTDEEANKLERFSLESLFSLIQYFHVRPGANVIKLFIAAIYGFS